MRSWIMNRGAVPPSTGECDIGSETRPGLWQIGVRLDELEAGRLRHALSQEERMAAAVQHHHAIARMRELNHPGANLEIALVPSGDERGARLLVAVADPEHRLV